MPNNFLSGAAGLLQGIARKKQEERAFERQRPMLDLQREMMKLQIQNSKVKQTEMEIKNNLVNAMISQWQQQQAQAGQQAQTQAAQAEEQAAQGPQFGDSFKPSGGLPDMMADMDPNIAAVMEMYTDIPFTKSIGQSETRRHNRVTERNADRDYNLRATEQVPVQIVDESGAPGIRTVPKYSRPEFIQTGPPPVENYTFDKEGVTYEGIREKQTGKPINEPRPIKPVSGESSETASKIALAKNALTYTAQMRAAFITPQGINRKLVFAANAPGGGIGEGRKLKAMFLDALDARARAATGAAMPDSEVKNYTRMYFPSPIDDDATIADKFQRLDSFMTDYLQVMDPSGAIRKRMSGGGPAPAATQGAPPASALKEGVGTKFKNGQVWTLQNGQPTRVQ